MAASHKTTALRKLYCCLLAMAFCTGTAAGSGEAYCEFTPAAKTDWFVPGLIVGADVMLPEGTRP